MGRGLRPGGIVVVLALLVLPAAVDASNATFPLPQPIPAGYQGPEAALPMEYPNPRTTGRRCLIGFQNPDAQTTSYWFIQLAVVRKAKVLGCKVIALNDALSSAKQVANMKQLLAKKVDAIIFYPLSSSAATPVLQKAQTQKVPVVGIDASTWPTTKVPLIATQVWDGLDIQAFLQAQVLARVRKKAKLGLIGLAIPIPAINYLEAREEHWARTIGHATILGSRPNPNGRIAGGEHAAHLLLAQHRSIDAVIAYNDATAIGTFEASVGPQVAIIGNEGSEVGAGALFAQELWATVQTDAIGVGVQSAIAAYSLIMQQHLPLTDVVLRPPRVWHACNQCAGPVSWQTLLQQIG